MSTFSRRCQHCRKRYESPHLSGYHDTRQPGAAITSHHQRVRQTDRVCTIHYFFAGYKLTVKRSEVKKLIVRKEQI